jgi:hypothetical protein
MKVLGRYIIYSVAIILLIIGCVTLFKEHPEVQFAFIMPGLFIIAFSVVRDDISRRNNITYLRAGLRGR